LCLVEPTFRNAIAYGAPTLRDSLHKTTARGTESFSSTEIILNSSTLACRDYNYITLTDTSQSNVTLTFEHQEWLGNGTFNVEDLGCYVTEPKAASYLSVFIDHIDGSYESAALFYYRNQNEPGITSQFPDSINYYNYDEVDTPPEQIPQSYINAFLALGSGGWDTINKVLANDPSGNPNSLWASGMRMDYRFTNTEGRNGAVIIDFGPSQARIYCFPIDGEADAELVTHSDMIAGNFTVLDNCKTQLTRSYQATSERDPIKNRSPYRGTIDD